MRPEALLWKKLQAILKKSDVLMYHRIETGETAKGIPDVYVLRADGTPLWIELKVAKLDKDARIKFAPGEPKPAQMRFLLAHPGTAALLVGVGNQCVILLAGTTCCATRVELSQALSWVGIKEKS
jgi:hypothetical protein